MSSSLRVGDNRGDRRRKTISMRSKHGFRFFSPGHFLPVPLSVPNKTLVLASCSLVKRDVSGMVVGTVFFVQYTTVRIIYVELCARMPDIRYYY
jgi:hypothetical protein